jgi:hypothetical protein
MREYVRGSCGDSIERGRAIEDGCRPSRLARNLLEMPRVATELRLLGPAVVLLCLTACVSEPESTSLSRDRRWEGQMHEALAAEQAGDVDRARDHFEAAFEIVRTDESPKMLELAYTCWHLGDLYFREPQLIRMEGSARSERLLEMSLASFQQYYGPEHPVVIPVLLTLGAVYERRGDEAGARALVEEADRVTARSFPESHFLRSTREPRPAASLPPQELLRLLHEREPLDG